MQVWKENKLPCVSAKFYKVIVQSILLFCSETWVLSTAALARLEGFHLHAAYRMARKHVPHQGLRHQWIYPPSDRVLEECGMHTISCTTSICRGRRLRSTWSTAASLLNARGQMKVVVGEEDVLGQCLMQLDLAIEPFCSSLEPFRQRGTQAVAVEKIKGHLTAR